MSDLKEQLFLKIKELENDKLALQSRIQDLDHKIKAFNLVLSLFDSDTPQKRSRKRRPAFALHPKLTADDFRGLSLHDACVE